MLSLEIFEKAPEGFHTSIWDVTSLCLFANLERTPDLFLREPEEFDSGGVREQLEFFASCLGVSGEIFPKQNYTL